MEERQQGNEATGNKAARQLQMSQMPADLVGLSKIGSAYSLFLCSSVRASPGRAQGGSVETYPCPS